MPEQNSLANDIFLHAVELTPVESRPAYLASACGRDAALRQQVEDLLAAYQDASRLLKESADHLPGTATLTCPDPTPMTRLTALSDGSPAIVESLSPDPPRQNVGPYKLIELIGEGGMGVVYLAAQETPVRRKVALKIIKPGLDTRQVVARFEAERQALAMMDHPNIARVLDAGSTETGRPYFVMELVKGIPITESCTQQQLSRRERLKLFVDVCQAVQHAHQKGIIHRDLKPSNILVTLHDGRPLVKVIDFGVAKAIEQQLTEHTVYTGFLQLVGTPLYMSPEQAALSSVDVDTRSDVYSLGVLLYELLTGTTPFKKETLRSTLENSVGSCAKSSLPAPVRGSVRSMRNLSPLWRRTNRSMPAN